MKRNNHRTHWDGFTAVLDKLLNAGIQCHVARQAGRNHLIVGVHRVEVFVSREDDSMNHCLQQRIERINALKIYDPKATAISVRLKEDPADNEFFIVPIDELDTRNSEVRMDDIRQYKDRWENLTR